MTRVMRWNKTRALVLLIVLAALGLRLYRLDFFSLRGDESFTVLFVQKPLAQMWQETLTVEPNPPLLYFLLRGWLAVSGDGEFAARFFSVWFGVLCVPLLFRLAREIFASRKIALASAFLIAINPYQLWHSQDVRNYTLWVALSLGSLVLFWRWYAPRPARRETAHARARWLALGGFVGVELLALYAHYYEAFLLLALNLFVFATKGREWQVLAQWLGAQLALALLYLPYPLVLSNRVAGYGEGSGRQGVMLWDMARETVTSFVLSDTLDAGLRARLWIPFALVILAALVALLARDFKRGLFFLLYAGMPTLAVFGLNLFRPLYLERYLNVVAPAYYVLLAYGIVVGARALAARLAVPPLRRIAISVALILCAFAAAAALANYWTNPAYAKAPDWRSLARIIRANAANGDVIVQNFPETSLVYYLRQPNIRAECAAADCARKPLPLVVYPETYLPDAKTTQQLNGMSANYTRVWFLPAAPDVWDPDQFVEQWLDHRGDLLNEWTAGALQLRLYGAPQQYLNAMQRINLPANDALTLLGYAVRRQPDAGARIVLYWRAQKNISADYRVRVTRLAQAGSPIDDKINRPVRDAYPTTGWRKNEIVVDQYDFPNNLQAAAFTVELCANETGADACQPVLDPGARAPARLPIRP